MMVTLIFGTLVFLRSRVRFRSYPNLAQMKLGNLNLIDPIMTKIHYLCCRKGGVVKFPLPGFPARKGTLV